MHGGFDDLSCEMMKTTAELMKYASRARMGYCWSYRLLGYRLDTPFSVSLAVCLSSSLFL